MRQHTHFEVSSSARFGDKLGCTTKFRGSRDLGHALLYIFFTDFGDTATVRLCTKFQVCISTRFGDMLVCTPKFRGVRDLGHAPFLDFFSRVFEILPICVCVPNSKSLALLILWIR